MSKTSRIWADVDYDRQGKQVGWLYLHHSVTRSAYGQIMIPVAVIKNGDGPTALFTAGNHGDEYEGQIALVELIRELEPEAIHGRVIILPALNLPAALASARVSPLDDGNLNRSFPGDPDGGPTRQIAHYVDSVLFPMADLFHDLHSGGGSLAYLPFSSVHWSADPALHDRCMAALRAFGTPLSVVWKAGADERYSPHAAMRHGIVTMGGEFGGGGSVNIGGLSLVRLGLRRTLAHLGIIELPADIPAAGPIRMVEVPTRDHFLYAPEPGLFEPVVELGAVVARGDLAGLVHFVDNPMRPPVPCHFKAEGMAICRRHPGRCERGDCLYHLAVDVTA